jgi:class 3 adenylate cyclase
MLTDLHGYSERTSTSSRESLSELVKTHNNLIRPIVDFYRGRVVKGLGDAFLCVFESATDAAVCAIAIQIVIQEFNKMQKEPSKKLSIRIMLNSGDVTLDSGDIYGDAVNIVSRMEKLPHFKDGGVGMSESTYLLVNRQEIKADSIGEHSFKGIVHPVKVYKLPLERQNLTELPTRLLDLVQNIASGRGFINHESKKILRHGFSKKFTALLIILIIKRFQIFTFYSK